MKHNQGEMEQNESGAKRESNKGRGRFDLLPYEALEAWAIWSEEGAVKYGDRNWEKGLLVSDCINRLVRHATKASNGWTDEDHLAACMWNAAAAITMMARIPEFNDHAWHYEPAVNKETTTLFGDYRPGMTIEEYVLSDKEAKKRQDAINKQLEEEKSIKKAEINHNFCGMGDLINNGENEQYLNSLKDFCLNKINQKRETKVKGIPINEYIAQEKAKKEQEEIEKSMKQNIDNTQHVYEKKLLGIFRSITCLNDKDRDFLRLSMDCEGLDIPAVDKWLKSRESFESEEFPKPIIGIDLADKSEYVLSDKEVKKWQDTVNRALE